jgi:hypothetical protein
MEAIRSKLGSSNKWMFVLLFALQPSGMVWFSLLDPLQIGKLPGTEAVAKVFLSRTLGLKRSPHPSCARTLVYSFFEVPQLLT